MTVAISTELMRSLIARSMRSRPTRYWFSKSSPSERTRRLPRLSMSSISPRPSRRPTRTFSTAMTSSLRSTRMSSGQSCSRRMFIFTRPHDPVDVEEGVLAAGVLVHPQGVAHVGADRHVVDVEHVDGLEADIGQGLDAGGVELVAGLGVDLAGLGVALVAGQVAADQGVGRQGQGGG